MAPLPAPIRAGLGLLATALDAVQELVEHAPEIPMEAVGNSMQLSLRLQQHYVALLTRGDEFIAGLRGAPDEPPSWATFDDLPPSAAEGDETGADSQPAAVDDEPSDFPAAELQEEPRQAGQGDPLLDAALSAHVATGAGSAGTTAPAETVGEPQIAAKKAGARKAPAKKAPAAKVPAKKAAREAPAVAALAEAASAEAVLAPKAPEKKAPAKRAPARKTAATKAAVSATDSLPSAPQLDAALVNGAASARPQSAFDLAEPTGDAPDADPTPNDSLPVDVPVLDSPIVDALVDGEPAGQEAPGSVPGA